MAKTNLSNRSINLLRNDNTKRYKGYVLGQREDEFATWAVLGNAFHLLMELWNINGTLEIEKIERFIDTESKGQEQEVVDGLHQGIQKLYTNLQSCIHDFVRTKQAEACIIIELNETYNLKAKIDALHETNIQDYKTVSSFTKEDDQAEKYGQQAMIYQYIIRIKTGKKFSCIMTEILKRIPSLMRKTKNDLIAMCENFDEQDSTLKKDEIIEKYKLIPQVHQHIEFERQDNLIEQTERLIQQAIHKANRLKSVPTIDLVI